MDDVHNRLVALFKISGVDVTELTLALDVITGLNPRLLLINLGKRIVHPINILEQSAEHVAVKEEFALELGVVEKHKDEGDRANPICSQSERIKLIKLLQNANRGKDSKQDSACLDAYATAAVG